MAKKGKKLTETAIATANATATSTTTSTDTTTTTVTEPLIVNIESNRSNIESNLEKINKINLKPSLSRHVEQELSEGYQYIIGLDEAGRGPLGKVITLRHVVQLIVYI